MPEFTMQDRHMIEAEQTMWHVAQLLDNVQGGGAWRKRIGEVNESVLVIASELRAYNDQFEIDEDE